MRTTSATSSRLRHPTPAATITLLLSLLLATGTALASGPDELSIVPEVRWTLADGETATDHGPAWRATRWQDPLADRPDVATDNARIDWNLRQVVVDTTIEFEFGSATLSPATDALLDEIAQVLDAIPDLAVRVEGHTDDVGALAFNMRLSEDRAQSVRTALIARGITAERLTTRGLGPTVPLDQAGTDQARERNRRVEFHMETADHRRHVAFVLDASSRTLDALRASGDPSTLLNQRLADARAMLAPFTTTEDILVSLWTFAGPADNPTIRQESTGLDARQAQDALADLLRTRHLAGPPADPARAAHAVARELLGLADNPAAPIPDGAPHLTILHLSGAPQAPSGAHAAWLQRHTGTQQVHWVDWNLADGLATTDDDRPLFLVQWGQPARLRTLNRLAPPEDSNITLAPWPWISISRAVTGAGIGADTLRCSTPGEALADLPGRLEFRIQPPATLPIARADRYAEGPHPLHPAVEMLCTELGRHFPGVTFVFPTAPDGTASPMGLIEVISLYQAVVRIEGLDGTPDATPPAMHFDRLHRAFGGTRGFRASAPAVEGADDARLRWRKRLVGEGEQPEHELLRWEGAEGTLLESGTNEDVRLTWPARPQRLHGFGRDFRAQPGDYTVEVCATLDWPDAARRSDVHVDLVCESCRDARRVSDDQLCFGWVQQVERRPLAWWWILLLGLLLWFVLWAVFRWRGSTEFPDGLRVANVDIDLARMQNRLDAAIRRFRRRPLHLAFNDGEVLRDAGPPGVTVHMARANAEWSGLPTVRRRPVLAIMPEHGGLRVWAVAPTRSDNAVEATHVMLRVGQQEVPVLPPGTSPGRRAPLLAWRRLREPDAEESLETRLVYEARVDGAPVHVIFPVWIRRRRQG